MSHSIHQLANISVFMSTMRVPSSSSKLSLRGWPLVSLIFPRNTSPPNRSTPITKSGCISLHFQNSTNLLATRYMNLVAKPSRPMAKCLTAVGKVSIVTIIMKTLPIDIDTRMRMSPDIIMKCPNDPYVWIGRTK